MDLPGKEYAGMAPSKTAGFLMASAVPLVAFIATASGHAYWHDSGEFVASAVDFGLTHPPGHPLNGIVSGLALLLPFGPLAFRVALVSGLLGALCSGVIFLATRTTVVALGFDRPRAAFLVSLGAAWVVTGSTAFWFQSVRPEVYALNALLVLVVLERIVHVEATFPKLDLGAYYTAAFVTGLALANHHFLAFLVLPAVVMTTLRIKSERGLRPMGGVIASGFAGLLTYVYLPIRSFADPLINLGQPTTPSNFFWLVSAKAFQKATHTAPRPVVDRTFDVLIQFAESISLPAVIMAFAGAYALLRAKHTRRIAFVWVATLVSYAGARIWLGFVRGNPDAQGYLMPGIAAAGVLAACFLAWVGAVATNAMPDKKERLANVVQVVIGLVCTALGVVQFAQSAEYSSLAHFTATDAQDEVTWRAVPSRAIVFAHDPQSVFRYYDVANAEGARPDVVMVPVPFLSYPGMVERLAEQAPELKDTLRSYLYEGRFMKADLSTLANKRPVLVEMDVRVPQDLYEMLVPHGIFYTFLPNEVYADERAVARHDHAKHWDTLNRLLSGQYDEDAQADLVRGDETRNRLLWRHYIDALYFAAVGERASARESVVAAMALNPKATELVALDEALESDDDGPIDITPFLPPAE